MIEYGTPVTFDNLCKENLLKEEAEPPYYRCEGGLEQRKWGSEDQINKLLYKDYTKYSKDGDGFLVPTLGWRANEIYKKLKKEYIDRFDKIIPIMVNFGELNVNLDIDKIPENLSENNILIKHLLNVYDLFQQNEDYNNVEYDTKENCRSVFKVFDNFFENPDAIEKKWKFGAYLTEPAYNFLTKDKDFVGEIIKNGFVKSRTHYTLNWGAKIKIDTLSKAIASKIHNYILQQKGRDSNLKEDEDEFNRFYQNIADKTKFCLTQDAFNYLALRIEMALSSEDMNFGNLRDGVAFKNRLYRDLEEKKDVLVNELFDNVKTENSKFYKIENVFLTYIERFKSEEHIKDWVNTEYRRTYGIS